MAFNGAADRIEKQLRRYVKRLQASIRRRGAQPFVENAGYTIFSRSAGRGGRSADFPAIVAETRVDIPESSVSDAVMLMDLRNTNALMFKNSGDRRVQHDLPPRGREYRLGRAASRLSPSSDRDRRSPGLALRESPFMQLADFLDFDAIKTALPGGSKRALLQQLANLAGQRLGLDPAAILASLTEREKLGSTGFGQGVAIPHGKIEGLSGSTACSRGLPSRSIIRRSTGARSISSSCSCPRPTPAPSI